MTTPAGFRSLPHARAWTLAWPLILSNITVPLVGVVDTAMLGHFSDERHIGAVALGATVLAAVWWVLSFIRLGTTSLVGQSIGAGDRVGAVRHVQRSIVLAVIISATLLAVQWLVVPVAMGGLAPAGETRDLAVGYTQIRAYSVPAILLTLVAVGWFIGAQDSRRPLALAVTVNVLNVGLDVVFVGVLGWQSAGAAVASLIAEWCGLALAAVLLWTSLTANQRAALRVWAGVGLRRGWRALLGMNGNLFVRTVVLYSVVLFVASRGSYISPSVLAANAILLQLVHVASYGLDGYAHAAEALTAEAVGRRDQGALHRAVGAAFVAAAIIAVAVSTAFWFAREPIVRLMTDLPDLADLTLGYYGWVALLPLVSVAAYTWDGVFIGTGRSREMRDTMIAGTLAVFVPALLVGTAVLADPNHALWLAFTLFNGSRGVLLGAAYLHRTRRRSWFVTPTH